MFPPKVIEAARLHAIADYPNESCGLVVDNKYEPCKNIHPEPSKHFRIHGNKIASAYKRGKLQAVIHSHPDGPFFPSAEDMESQQAMKLPWGIIFSRPDSAAMPLWFGDQAPVAPLEGREFIHGVYDCFSLIRDYYRQELGIVLLDKGREDEWWSKSEGNEDFYLKYHAEAGFVQLKDGETPQAHDVILMKIRSDVPNHGAVYVGGDTLIHHMAGRKSTREEAVMKWNRHIVGYFRHSSQIKDTPDAA